MPGKIILLKQIVTKVTDQAAYSAMLPVCCVTFRGHTMGKKLSERSEYASNAPLLMSKYQPCKAILPVISRSAIQGKLRKLFNDKITEPNSQARCCSASVHCANCCKTCFLTGSAIFIQRPIKSIFRVGL